MANRERYRNGLLRPVIPLKNVNISTANSRTVDLNQDIVVSDLWDFDIFHPDAAFGFGLDECFHSTCVPNE